VGISASFKKPRWAAKADHGVVFREEGAFCGWPFYCGLWTLPGGEVLAGFKRIPSAYGAAAEISHTRLTVGQGRLVTIRSYDGGESFDPASLSVVFDLGTSAEEILRAGGESYDDEPPLDFLDPMTIVMSGAMPALLKPDSRAWLRASADGGRTWRRTILLPLHGLASLTGHGPPTVRADGVAILGLATTSADGWTNRPLVYASTDGGRWNFLSFITPQIEGGSAVSDRTELPLFGAIRHFYARPLALRDGRILASLRFQRDARGIFWTDIFESEDGARTWRFLSRVNDWGAPGDIVETQDGRIVCVYGYRLAPFGIRARVSEDGGRSWGSEIVLRDDGGSWDLGYPRVVEAAPGRLLTVYYFNRKDDPMQLNGGVRHIARTLFSPD
jgi:hypothetical protein